MILRVIFSALLATATLPTAHAQPARAWHVIQNDFIERAPAVPEVHASTIVEAADGALEARFDRLRAEECDDLGICRGPNRRLGEDVAANAWRELGAQRANRAGGERTATFDGREIDVARFDVLSEGRVDDRERGLSG